MIDFMTEYCQQNKKPLYTRGETNEKIIRTFGNNAFNSYAMCL